MLNRIRRFFGGKPKPKTQLFDVVQPSNPRTNLRGAVFDGSDLRGADFTGVDLTDTSFKFCDVRCAIFEGAEVKGATFDGAIGLASVKESHIHILTGFAERVIAENDYDLILEKLLSATEDTRNLRDKYGDNLATCLIIPIPEFTALLSEPVDLMLAFLHSVVADQGKSLASKYL